MNENVKPIVEEVLQLTVDGKLNEISQVIQIIDKHFPREVSFDEMMEITTHCQEVIMTCGIIPNAKAFAERHGLTVVC